MTEGIGLKVQGLKIWGLLSFCRTGRFRYLGVSQNLGYQFRGPHIKDYSILGSILGSPYLGKLPFVSEAMSPPLK